MVKRERSTQKDLIRGTKVPIYKNIGESQDYEEIRCYTYE